MKRIILTILFLAVGLVLPVIVSSQVSDECIRLNNGFKLALELDNDDFESLCELIQAAKDKLKAEIDALECYSYLPYLVPKFVSCQPIIPEGAEIFFAYIDNFTGGYVSRMEKLLTMLRNLSYDVMEHVLNTCANNCSFLTMSVADMCESLQNALDYTPDKIRKQFNLCNDVAQRHFDWQRQF